MLKLTCMYAVHAALPRMPCLQDADSYWALTPPAEEQLLATLANSGDTPAEGGTTTSTASLVLTWRLQRDLPPPSEHGRQGGHGGRGAWLPVRVSTLMTVAGAGLIDCRGCAPRCLAGGPVCTGSLSIPLAAESQRQLAAVLQGLSDSAQLLRLPPPPSSGTSSSNGSSPQASAALYPLVWLLRGDACTSRPLRASDVGSSNARRGGSSSGGSGGALDWAGQWLACNASLMPLPPAPGLAAAEGESAASSPAAEAVVLPTEAGSTASRAARQLLASNSSGSSVAAWWQLGCQVVNASGHPIEPLPPPEGAAECGAPYTGPRYCTAVGLLACGTLGLSPHFGCL